MPTVSPGAKVRSLADTEIPSPRGLSEQSEDLGIPATDSLTPQINLGSAASVV